MKVTDNSDIIKMITQTLSQSKLYYSKNELWKSLPKQIPHAEFILALNYLEESQKIVYDKDETIVWIAADNAKLKNLLKTSKLLR